MASSGSGWSSSRAHFWSYTFPAVINDLPGDIICNIAIYADNTTLHSKCDQASDLWQQLELATELESDLRDTVDWVSSGLLISMLGKLSWLCFTGVITIVLLM